MNVNYIGPLREQQGLSQSDLGDQVGVTRQTIAVWEKGERLPSLGQLSRIAAALHVSVDVFLRPAGEEGEAVLLFRADDASALTIPVRAQIQQQVIDYRELEEILGEIPKLPPASPLDTYDSGTVERLSREVRDFLGADDAPLGDVITLLEDRGFKVILTPLPKSVSGFSAYTQDWGGVIVVNKTHAVERQYFTALHELAHLICHRKDYHPHAIPAPHDTREKIANHLAGAVLLPRDVIEFELRAYHDTWIPEPVLISLKYRYSVSMRTVLMRAKQLGIIPARQSGQQIGQLNKLYGKESEPTQLKRLTDVSDVPGLPRTRLERLVYQAARDGHITRSRAAEILGQPVRKVRENLGLWMAGVQVAEERD